MTTAEASVRDTTNWTESAVVGTAKLMLMTERQNPERVAAFLARIATQLPKS